MDKILAWIRRRPVSSAGLAALAILAIFTLTVVTKTPGSDLRWDEHLAHMPKIVERPDGVSLAPVIDWAYDANGPVSKTETSFDASYADLRHIWFMVEPQPGGEYAAHTLVLFEFAGDRIVGVSVEARLEQGETYSATDGVFNNYELAFMWGSAKEFLTRRAIFLKKDLYLYPLKLTPEQQLTFFRSMLATTQDIEVHPRFYNTFTSNCTNELAKAAHLGWHYSWVLTGYSPQRLFSLGLIPGASFDAAKAGAKIDAEIRSWNSLPSPDFDRALAAELRRRYGE
ncbi:MAG TPA: DUF4105 domain-containing protein [Hyphomonadaceae bacterium]|nr:DUF4105 domain-containing protein [Hyphomonadaceae bacterium]